jgi:hypothetical protein
METAPSQRVGIPISQRTVFPSGTPVDMRQTPSALAQEVRLPQRHRVNRDVRTSMSRLQKVSSPSTPLRAVSKVERRVASRERRLPSRSRLVSIVYSLFSSLPTDFSLCLPFGRASTPFDKLRAVSGVERLSSLRV